jgi:glycosyltransferase involved in cell wall biosynthesis
MDIGVNIANCEIRPMPLISVIIPTYNRARFVVKAIDSVLNQKFTDYEIIVIDDGSTDDTQTVLVPYSNNIRYIYQENAGVSAARNTGIKKASGEWISFLDSDDEWKEDYLSTQMAQIKQYPNALIYMTNATSISPNGERSNFFSAIGILENFDGDQSLYIKRPLNLIVKHSATFLQSTILRKNTLINVGLFDTSLSIAEDLDIISRAALQGTLVIIRKELVEVYRRKESIQNLMAQSMTRGISRYKAFGKVYENLLISSHLTRVEKASISRALSYNWRALGNILIIAGRKTEARQFYKVSFYRYPSILSLIKFLTTFLPMSVSRILVRKGRNILSGED